VDASGQDYFRGSLDWNYDGPQVFVRAAF